MVWNCDVDSLFSFNAVTRADWHLSVGWVKSQFRCQEGENSQLDTWQVSHSLQQSSKLKTLCSDRQLFPMRVLLTRSSISKQAFCVKPCKSATSSPLPHLLRRHGVWQGRGTGILQIKGKKTNKQWKQGGNIMRCVFKWMCEKHFLSLDKPWVLQSNLTWGEDRDGVVVTREN